MLRLRLAALAVAFLPAAALAEPVRDSARFDLVMLGLTAGTLQFDGTEEDGRYRVQGLLASSGLLSFVRKVSYDAAAEGQVSGTTYSPARYTEKADTGRRQSQAEIVWQDSVPELRAYSPPRKPRKTDVDPATQSGSIDPLTALYATLRDAAPGAECNRTFAMFDGRRASRLSLGEPKRNGNEVTCDGEYRRVAGFSKQDMAEKTRFPFTLTYAVGDDGRMQVVEVAMETLYGQARLVRR